MEDRVPVLRFSTEEVPRVAERFDAWRERVSGWMDLLPAGGDGARDAPPDFRLAHTTHAFGPLALSRSAALDPARSDRSRARARRDALDHWVVHATALGAIRAEVDGEAVEGAPGRVHLYAMHQPARNARGAAEWTQLFVPRDAAPELAPLLDSRLGGELAGPIGHLLSRHLAALPAALDGATRADGARAAEATLALLRAAASGGASADAMEAARAPLAAAERARVAALIRAHLRSARLTPDRLARLAGVSRTRLYEVFDADGGVARAIQRERLRAARRALADPADRRPVAVVAEAVGMPDPSVFSRAFRREFGETPREFRERAALGLLGPPPSRADGAAPGGMGEMLRRLGR